MQNFPSAPNLYLRNATTSVPVASVVGGGSVVNGMAYMRGSRADYDAWETLGNPGWGWEGLLPYFKKSSTFLPPSPDTAKEWNMTYDPAMWDHGPLHVTISDFQYPDLQLFFEAWRNAGVEGVEKKRDIAAGNEPGVYWIPSTVDRRDQTRSTARKAYYDPVFAERKNLRLLTLHTTVEILFDKKRGELVAKGVKIASRITKETSEVYAREEVILAAGAVHTPHLLQVSGLGPKAVLEAAHIRVKKDIPGIGANLQDHATVTQNFNISHQAFPNPNTISTNATYNASVWEEYWNHKTGPIAGGTPSLGVALSLSQMISIITPSITLHDIWAGLLAQTALYYLPPIYTASPPLFKGFLKQRDIIAASYINPNVTIAQFPFTGSGFAYSSFLKPVSRGTITLNSTNPGGPPVVQYNTMQNSLDRRVLIVQVQFAREFWKRQQLAHFHPVEINPGAQYHTEAEILESLTYATASYRGPGNLQPGLAHLSGTAAMMPEELGGVVDTELKVYGVEGLRIVDASIMPMIVSGGLQATVYAVAEKASDLIKGEGKRAKNRDRRNGEEFGERCVGQGNCWRCCP
ncbi:alcohol oxidase [Delitschia confertaspora ATCC 74209]|uniref:Alcohol oxidase n=1 Tax=Delitschia confertaspora ATCC 74209 TaxID=1513339 RepID=A0A9P4JSE0_9PLEO|nr:alcohol oxidase [Delitschia confertaspora ATCC 74209]